MQFGSPDICLRASLHIFKDYLGLFCSRYKNERYQAAEKLFGAYRRAAYNKGIAFLAESFNDSASKNIEFVYLYVKLIYFLSVI